MLMGTLMSARPRYVKLVLAHSFPLWNSFIPPQKRLIYLDIHTKSEIFIWEVQVTGKTGSG